MMSSTVVVSPSPPKPSTSDVDDEEYETEYEEIEEEIEVEEEIEIEEEVDVEVNHDECGGEDGIGGLVVAQEESLKNDTDKVVELDEHEDHVQSLTQGVYVSHQNMGDVKTPESSDKEELYGNGRKNSKYNNQKTLLSDSGEANHAKTTSSIGVLNANSIMAKAFGENVNAITSHVAETNQSAVDGVCNTLPRLHDAQIRLRDALSSAEFDRESKKLRIVCEFHAKGWCIRGSSCRFLHIKDGPDEVIKESDAMGREASFSACIPPLQSGKNRKLDSETEALVPPKDDIFLGAPAWEDRGSFRHNLHLDNYRYYDSPPIKGSLSVRGSAYLGSSSTTSHDNNRDTRLSGFGLTVDEIINKRSNIGSTDTRLADLPYSLARQPLPFGSSSWKNSAHVPPKFLESSLEHHAYVASSMKQSTPPASRSESETMLHSCIFRDAEPAKYQIIISSFGWEPSVPFRPSHETIRSIFLKGRLYNPMRDHIDKKDVKDGTSKFSFSDQGSSIKNLNVQLNSPEEKEELLNMVYVGHVVNDDKVKHDKQRDGAVLEVDGTAKIDNIDDDFKGDDHVQSESNAFKYFQSALIEYVKELVKPTWREGFLSKDAHKLIVKKAVDKVLSTLQPHQIPSTAESVKFYLGSSQPKLAKLVEGYLIYMAKLEMAE